MYTEGVLVKAVDSWRLSAVLHRKREKREKSMEVGGGFCAGEVFTSKTEPGPVSEQSFREVRWIRDNGRTIVTIDRGIGAMFQTVSERYFSFESICVLSCFSLSLFLSSLENIFCAKREFEQVNFSYILYTGIELRKKKILRERVGC